MSKKGIDQLFASLLQKDRIGEPDEAIESRLMYSFMLKSGVSKPRQNSFAAFFAWMFSIQGIGLKTGLASIALLVSLMTNHFKSDQSGMIVIDSLTSKRVLVADSTRVFQNIDSTCTNFFN